jgi:hypothetical protein
VITKFRYLEALRLVVPVIVSLLAGSSALAGELGTLTSAARDFVSAARAQQGILISYPTAKVLAASTITYAAAKERYYSELRSAMPILMAIGLKQGARTSELEEFRSVFRQFDSDDEQTVAKATAEMLQRFENDQAAAAAEKEFERAQEIEAAFEKDFDGLDGAQLMPVHAYPKLVATLKKHVGIGFLDAQNSAISLPLRTTELFSLTHASYISGRLSLFCRRGFSLVIHEPLLFQKLPEVRILSPHLF